MALQWTSALSMGVPVIDAQHRELFARVDRLHDAMLRHDRSEAARLIGFLRDYVVVHFAAEEQLMAESEYADAARHTEEHRRFEAALRELEAELHERGASAALVLRLEQEAVGWLRDHVYFTDTALGRWLLGGQATATARTA